MQEGFAKELVPLQLTESSKVVAIQDIRYYTFKGQSMTKVAKFSRETLKKQSLLHEEIAFLFPAFAISNCMQ